MELDPSDPTGHTTITLIYSADAIFAAGGDIAISPDNIDVSKDYIMINEDGTGSSRPQMAAKGRDGAIWRFTSTSNIRRSQRHARRAWQSCPARPRRHAVGPAVWETSGSSRGRSFRQRCLAGQRSGARADRGTGLRE